MKNLFFLITTFLLFFQLNYSHALTWEINYWDHGIKTLLWNDYNPVFFQDGDFLSYGWIVRAGLWYNQTEMKKYKFIVRDVYKNIITEIDLNFSSWSVYHSWSTFWRNEIISRFKVWEEVYNVVRFQEFNSDDPGVRIQRTAFFVFTSLWRFRLINEEIPINDYNIFSILNKAYFKVHNWFISVWDETMYWAFGSHMSYWVKLWNFWNNFDQWNWWAPLMDHKASNVSFYSGWTDIIYFRSGKFYLWKFYDNDINWTEREIFYWSNFESVPEYRIDLSSTYKIWVKKSNVIPYKKDWFQFYMISVCRDSDPFPFPWSPSNNVILQTKYNIENPWVIWYIVVDYFQRWFLDYINWWRTLKTTDNLEIIDYGAECTTDYWYFQFVEKKPYRVYWIREWSLFYKNLSKVELDKIVWTWWPDEIPPELNDWTISGDDFINKIFDLDWDWDWEIELWETAIAPITIIKNIITQIYYWFQNIWQFIMIILESTKVEPPPDQEQRVYTWIYAWFKNWVVLRSTDLLNWETEYSEIDKLVFNVKAWLEVWFIFFIIILAIVSLTQEWKVWWD